MIGIYRIIIGNKSYIGSSINLLTRKKQHYNDLRCNRHCNPFLQNAYNKYKEFNFEILETLSFCTDENLRILEKSYIKELKPEFNIQDPVTHFGQKKVYQFDKSGNFIAEYDNITVASIALGVSSSNLFHAAQENEKNTRTAAGFYWQYEREFKPRLRDKRETNIHIYTLAGFYIKSYSTFKECVKDLFSNKSYTDVCSRINRVCRGKAASFCGYRFSYKKVEVLDNTKLLSIKCFYPIIVIDPNNKAKVYERVSCFLKEYPNFYQASISAAILKNKLYKGYKFLKLGTESHELLETLKGTEATTELETIDVNA